MVLYGHLIVCYGLSWQNIYSIGLVSYFLAVIDPNAFGLVLVKIYVIAARIKPDKRALNILRHNWCLVKVRKN